MTELWAVRASAVNTVNTGISSTPKYRLMLFCETQALVTVVLTNNNPLKTSLKPSANALYDVCMESVSSYLRYSSTYSALLCQVTTTSSPPVMSGTVIMLP